MTINQNPQLVHYQALNDIKPSFRHDGNEPIIDWQNRARERLINLMGLNKIIPASDDVFTIDYKKEHDTFIEYSFRFQSENGYFVPCNLWVPKGRQGKLPLVICLQGHSSGFHISLGRAIYPDDENMIASGDRDFARQIIKEGYCSLAIEQRAFGECKGNYEGFPCILPSLTALLYGRTLLAERVFDISRSIDVVIKNFDMVDSNKIACMGNSGGGTATLYASAIDERIKVAMPSCAVCTFKDSIGAMYHCACNYVPNIANDFDMGDICGLIAPRKLIIVSGKKDDIFPKKGVEESVNIAKEYFTKLNVSNNVTWVEGLEGHRFYAKESWPVFHKFFD